MLYVEQMRFHAWLFSNHLLYVLWPSSRIKSPVVDSKFTYRERLPVNHLTPNDHYMGRTAQLTSRYCILFIYATNIRTEYFKHAA